MCCLWDGGSSRNQLFTSQRNWARKSPGKMTDTLFGCREACVALHGWSLNRRHQKLHLIDGYCRL